MRSELTLLAVLAVASVSLAAEKVDVAKAVEQAKAWTASIHKDDYDTFVGSTHPKLVELMGGKEKMIAATKQAKKILKDQGTTIKSHTIGKPQEPVVEGKASFLVLPTTMVLTAEGMKVVVESYLLASSNDSGKSWVFVDGGSLEDDDLKQKLFPKLPGGLKLPEPKEPTVTKE